MRPEVVSEESGEGGSYLAPPSPRITGAPRRYTTRKKEEGKKKTETRNPRSSPSAKTGQGRPGPVRSADGPAG